MTKMMASVLAALASASMDGCCGAVVFESDPANDGATVLVVGQTCGGTTGPSTSIFVNSNEVLRLSADPESVSVRWENDGATLIVSTPENEIVVPRR